MSDHPDKTIVQAQASALLADLVRVNPPTLCMQRAVCWGDVTTVPVESVQKIQVHIISIYS